MALSISTAARNALVNAAAALVDAGSGPGLLHVRSGAKPASPATAATGTLLATVTLADPAFGLPTSGTKTLTDPGPVTGLADGTAGYFHITDSDGLAIFDGTCGVTGSGADLILNTTAIATGVAFDILAGGALTMPAGS